MAGIKRVLGQEAPAATTWTDLYTCGVEWRNCIMFVRHKSHND